MVHCFEQKTVGRRNQMSVTRSAAECCLSNRDRSVVQSFWHATQRELLLAPRRHTSTTVKRCVRKRGIHALHSFGPCCRYAIVCIGTHTTGARPTKQSVRHPRAHRQRSRAWSRFAACGVGTGFEPATPRLLVWCSATELT